MKPLIEQGHLYIAMPPLYKIECGKEGEYAWTEEDRGYKIFRSSLFLSVIIFFPLLSILFFPGETIFLFCALSALGFTLVKS